MKIASIPAHILADVRRRGYSDEEIALMEPKHVFAEYCRWNNLTDWGGTLWDAALALNAADAPVEPKVVVVFESAFVELNDQMEALIAKYELAFTQRKTHQEGTIEEKRLKVSAGDVWAVSKEFIKNGFDVVVEADQVRILKK